MRKLGKRMLCYVPFYLVPVIFFTPYLFTIGTDWYESL
jgi:hypothetical protein